MNKKIILAIVTVLVLLVLGGGFLFASRNRPETRDEKLENTEVTGTEKTEENSITGTIYDLLNLGKSLKCTYSFNTDSNSSSGTTYISGKKMRGDFEISMNDTKIKSYMISDGEYFYSWSDNSKTGTKMKIDENENNTETEKLENQEATVKTAQEKYDYKCENWSVDNTMFQLPTDITFTDFSTMLENLKKEQ